MTRPDPRLVEMRRDALRATTAAKIQSRFDALLGVVSFTAALIVIALVQGDRSVSLGTLIASGVVMCALLVLGMYLTRLRLLRELAKTPVPHDVDHPRPGPPATPPAQ